MIFVCLIFWIIVTRLPPIRISISRMILTLKIGFSKTASKMVSGHISKPWGKFSRYRYTGQTFDEGCILKNWLFKNEFSKTEFGRVVLDWLTSLKDALISGSGSIEYIPVLNSLSAVTSARLAVEILRILRTISKITFCRPRKLFRPLHGRRRCRKLYFEFLKAYQIQK